MKREQAYRIADALTPSGHAVVRYNQRNRIADNLMTNPWFAEYKDPLKLDFEIEVGMFSHSFSEFLNNEKEIDEFLKKLKNNIINCLKSRT